MVKYILKRLLQLVVVLLGVTFLTFMITQAAPSDAADFFITGKYSLIKKLLLLELQRNFWTKYTMIGV